MDPSQDPSKNPRALIVTPEDVANVEMLEEAARKPLPRLDDVDPLVEDNVVLEDGLAAVEPLQKLVVLDDGLGGRPYIRARSPGSESSGNEWVDEHDVLWGDAAMEERRRARRRRQRRAAGEKPAQAAGSGAAAAAAGGAAAAAAAAARPKPEPKPQREPRDDWRFLPPPVIGRAYAEEQRLARDAWESQNGRRGFSMPSTATGEPIVGFAIPLPPPLGQQPEDEVDEFISGELVLKRARYTTTTADATLSASSSFVNISSRPVAG
ncbi:hypothetical protein GGTG_08631 [Gaeumannomyces tritici R3-111a-1]|uniref:Uncharacterized protein n=1 Tax=Gaeumannomyces tritici (strain R3-111a-1) TaxID=644352 RepID=J3P545_GAET3|nr:hypothetical protein GGTG_08631 [Gaeumannomyces tritici R3-111a-1]EJT74793.1 hypothetical protein GGTG_08631 [Gaeumannomyces tritici R3-111a-1]